VKGKMAYMSPEQALGEDLDRRSDLFSMGAMLFECLRGRRMWGDGTDVELMRKIALERPPTLEESLPGAPRALAELQERMVARDRNARPPTARDVAEQLRAFAVATGGPHSRRVLPATMTALFAADARKRRDRLAIALREASPSSHVALRRDLEMPEGAAAAPDALPRPRRPRWLVAAGASVLAALVVGAVGAVASATRSRPPVASSPSIAVSTPPAGAASPPPEAPAITPTPTATGAPQTSAPVHKPQAPRPSTPAARPAPLAKPPVPGKLPDVDPSPF
jgi:serine/threonine-protein kinase